MFLNSFNCRYSDTALEIYVLNRWGVRRLLPFPNPRPPISVDWLTDWQRKDKHLTSPIQKENWLHVNPLKCQNHSVSPTKTKLLKPCKCKTFIRWIKSTFLSLLTTLSALVFTRGWRSWTTMRSSALTVALTCCAQVVCVSRCVYALASVSREFWVMSQLPCVEVTGPKWIWTVQLGFA